MYTKLAFPEINLQIKEENGKLLFFDPIRKKQLVLTPEEWVRQHIIHYFVSQSYPKGLIATESGLKYNTLSKRTDIIVRDREGGVFMLVECKAPTIKINQKVVEQVTIYNQELKSKYLAVTNGLQWYCFSMDYEKHSFVQIEGVPEFI